MEFFFPLSLLHRVPDTSTSQTVCPFTPGTGLSRQLSFFVGTKVTVHAFTNTHSLAPPV